MLTAVELFAGAGGLGMGMLLAGFEHLAVIEWNRWACDTIRENQRGGHPLVSDWPLAEGDVRAFDYESIKTPVDVVVGGPPCQPFSICGKHRAHLDGRDMFPAMVDVVRRLQPRAFVVENVKGLTRESFASYFSYITLQFEFPELASREGETWESHLQRLQRERTSGARGGLTYNVVSQLLNAADFGVPQTRERVFMVGFRSDLAIRWAFPQPTHSKASLLAEKWETASYWERHRVPVSERGQPERRRRAGTTTWLRNLRPADERKPWRTVRDALVGLPDPESEADEGRAIFDHRFQPGVRFYPGHSGSPLDLPAKTLKAGDHGVPGGENALVRSDGSGRYFTIRESARLQGFPNAYRLHGSWTEAMRQLGNAVPVPLGHVVGASVARRLLEFDMVASAGPHGRA